MKQKKSNEVKGKTVFICKNSKRYNQQYKSDGTIAGKINRIGCRA